MKNWFEDIKGYFGAGLWTAEMVKNAVAKGKITAAQYETVTGEAYDAITGSTK